MWTWAGVRRGLPCPTNKCTSQVAGTCCQVSPYKPLQVPDCRSPGFLGQGNEGGGITAWMRLASGDKASRGFRVEPLFWKMGDTATHLKPGTKPLSIWIHPHMKRAPALTSARILHLWNQRLLANLPLWGEGILVQAGGKEPCVCIVCLLHPPGQAHTIWSLERKYLGCVGSGVSLLVIGGRAMFKAS